MLAGKQTIRPITLAPPLPALAQDAGVKAIISGLVSASAEFLLSSSFNGTGTTECQKPHSKYIDLIAEWRLDVFGKNGTSVGEMLPPRILDDPDSGPLLTVLVAGLVAVAALARILGKKRVGVATGRPGSKKVH